jgi:hypothetical protein
VDQLRPGDDHSAAAMAATHQGKISDAATHLNQASAAWAIAERDARNAAAAKTRAADAAPPKRENPVVTQSAPATQAAPTPPPVSSQPVSPPAASPQTVQTPTPPTAAPAPKVVANPSVEIEAVVATYARAIESRDIAEVRRAYPGATQAQLKGFDDFFKTLRSIRASFSVGSLDVQGDGAEARLSGTYDYVTNAGKSDRQSVSFQASFRRDAAGWKLTSVR